MMKYLGAVFSISANVFGATDRFSKQDSLMSQCIWAYLTRHESSIIIPEHQRNGFLLSNHRHRL
ncbi:MAG: hypothetical protein K0S45_4208 [Nitrospira sp.]|nr:hypothetical protein [Nitrospira sp.]